MSDTQLAHQVFRIQMHTPIPKLSTLNIDSKAVVETMRPQLTSSLTGFWNTSLFISNGLSKVQKASAGNLQIQLNNADDKIPYKHIDLVYDVDVTSDPEWIQIGQIILIGAGVVTTVVGILAGNPILIAAGVVIIIASILISVYEIVHEIVTVVPGGLGGAAILLVVGTLVGGYFLYTASGRERLTRPIREGVSRGGRYLGGQTREGFRQVGARAGKQARKKLKPLKKKLKRKLKKAGWH